MCRTEPAVDTASAPAVDLGFFFVDDVLGGLDVGGGMGAEDVATFGCSCALAEGAGCFGCCSPCSCCCGCCCSSCCCWFCCCCWGISVCSGISEDLCLSCSAPMLLVPRFFSGSAEASCMISFCARHSSSALDRSPDPNKFTLGGVPRGVGGFSRGGLTAVPSARTGEEGAEGVGATEGVGAAGGVGVADGISKGSLRET